MRTRSWTPSEIRNGNQVEQWLGLMIGAIITTLPSFLIMPIGAVYIMTTATVDNDNKPLGAFPFFVIGLVSGIMSWMIVLFLSSQ